MIREPGTKQAVLSGDRAEHEQTDDDQDAADPDTADQQSERLELITHRSVLGAGITSHMQAVDTLSRTRVISALGQSADIPPILEAYVRIYLDRNALSIQAIGAVFPRTRYPIVFA